MIAKCPVCGKQFDVLWPQLWRYKEEKKYICTWKCLRQLRKEEEEMAKMKKDGTPAKKPGPKPKNKTIIKGSPEKVFPKIETPEVPTVKLSGALNIETPEGEYAIRPGKITKPVNYDGFLTDVIRSPETGARYEVKDDTLFLKIGVDEFALEIDQWRKLLKEIPKAAAVLGVEL